MQTCVFFNCHFRASSSIMQAFCMERCGMNMKYVHYTILYNGQQWHLIRRVLRYIGLLWWNLRSLLSSMYDTRFSPVAHPFSENISENGCRFYTAFQPTPSTSQQTIKKNTYQRNKCTRGGARGWTKSCRDFTEPTLPVTITNLIAAHLICIDKQKCIFTHRQLRDLVVIGGHQPHKLLYE